MAVGVLESFQSQMLRLPAMTTPSPLAQRGTGWPCTTTSARVRSRHNCPRHMRPKMMLAVRSPTIREFMIDPFGSFGTAYPFVGGGRQSILTQNRKGAETYTGRL